MSFRKAWMFIPLSLLVLPAVSKANSDAIDRLEYAPAGTTYSRLVAPGSTKSLLDPVIFVWIRSNGRLQRVWDDDGFITMFLYNRSIQSRLQAGTLFLSDPLPMPTAPFLKAVEMLESIYESSAKHEAAEEDRAEYEARLQRVRALKRTLQRGGLKVSDLQTAGLGEMLTDFQDRHSYQVELGSGASPAETRLYVEDFPALSSVKLDWGLNVANFGGSRVQSRPAAKPASSGNR